jgi:predicted nucleotidyltransferase
MPAHIQIPQATLEALCQRYHVRRLILFGSVLREDFGLSSDVDMLVEFEQGYTPGLGFVRLQRELSELLGREVDLHTYRSLSRYFRRDTPPRCAPRPHLGPILPRADHLPMALRLAVLQMLINIRFGIPNPHPADRRPRRCRADPLTRLQPALRLAVTLFARG